MHETFSAAWTGVIGFTIIAAYSIAGALQILVWNPLAAVPGATLEAINAQIRQANESLGAPLVIAWAVIGTVLAAGVLFGSLAQRLSTERAGTLSLLIIVLGAPSYWFASFPAGMGIADTFATSGGDHSPWGMVLCLASALALAVLVFYLLRRRNRNLLVP